MMHWRAILTPGLISASLFLGACTAAAPAAPTATTAPKPAAPTTAPGASASPSASPAAAPSAAPKPSAQAASPVFDEQAVANFYRGKTIRIEAGGAAGGGYDAYSRLLAKYIGKYMPGNPTAVVENVPEAGGAVLANRMYLSDPKDGTLIGTFVGDLFLKRALGQKELQFDVNGWGHLGAPSISQYICHVTAASGFTSIREAINPGGKELILGAAAGQIEGQALIVKEVLGANIRTVVGYTGTATIRLAEQQGEVNGMCGNSWESLLSTNLDDLNSGNEKVLLQLISKARTDYPQGNAPTIFDFARNDDDRTIASVGSEGPGLYARPYVTPPGVPQDRVLALRRAFEMSMEDPGLLADAKTANLQIAPLKADEIERRINEAVQTPDTIKSRLRAIVIPNG